MKWKCKTCGCDVFNQEWISKRKFDKCLFDKEGYRQWYASYRDTDDLLVVCSDCGALGKKIDSIAEWGE